MGRPSDTTLVGRNQEIVALRQSGELSLGEIATRYNITRERARQIAAAGGVDAKKANAAHTRFVADREYARAEQHAGAILMLYVAGKSNKEIANSVGCQITSVREVLDEQITDEIVAARSRHHTAKIFPESQRGPREERPERTDRHWTPEAVSSALIAFARENGGRLPSSTKYQQLAPTREDLPSFATVRNRLGRWSDVRVDIHHAAR